MKLNRFHIYLLISLLVLAVLVVRDYNLSGRLEITTDFAQSQSRITTLNPPGNVNKGFVAQTPVTFKVRLPNYFDRVEAQLVTDPQGVPLQIGLVTSPEPEMTDLNAVLDLPPQTELKFQLDHRPGEELKPLAVRELKLVFIRDGHNVFEYLSLWKKSISKIF